MPKVDFDYLDIFSPLLVALIFAAILFTISFTCINWYCITHMDDLTVFEKLGTRFNLRLGPHSMAQIKRGGFASTYAREEAGGGGGTANATGTVSAAPPVGQRQLLKQEDSVAQGKNPISNAC